MKYAPVMPPACISLLDDIPCDAYFCYADVALAQPEYRTWFKGKPGIVLDNPIVELGTSVTPEEYGYLVRQMQPDFAMIPDVQFDKNATLALMTDYLARCGDECMAGVPQGRSEDEQVECALEMYSYGLRRLGIVRQGPRNGGAPRAHIIKRLATLGMDDVKYHLLGARHPYSDEIVCATFGLAVSVDTAEPVNATYLASGIRTAGAAVGRPAGFLQIQPDEFHVPLLRENIQDMQTWMVGVESHA